MAVSMAVVALLLLLWVVVEVVVGLTLLMVVGVVRLRSAEF